METTIRRSKFLFFCFMMLSVALWLATTYMQFHLFYFHYYFSIVSILYLIKILYPFIRIDGKRLKIYYGIFNNNFLKIYWDDVLNIRLDSCSGTMHSMAGGLVAASINEKFEFTCLKLKLSEAYSNKNVNPIQNNEFRWNPLDRDLIFFKEPGGGFRKLVGTINNYSSVEITKNINKREKLIGRILSFWLLFLFVIWFIVLVAWIARGLSLI